MIPYVPHGTIPQDLDQIRLAGLAFDATLIDVSPPFSNPRIAAYWRRLSRL